MIELLKGIYSILISSVDITDLVGDRIFPNIVPDKNDDGETVSYPLIVMNRVVVPEYSKSCVKDNATLIIRCYSFSYFEAIDIATAVRAALENFSGNADGILISDIKVDSVEEDFLETVYFQQLNFTVR